MDLFDRLPPLNPGDDEELWAAGVQESMRDFRSGVRERYTEGTLLRLLRSEDVKLRRASVLGLGFIGGMDANAAVASALHDADPLVQMFAADALWEIWFRGGTPEQNETLRRAVGQKDTSKSRLELDHLILNAPDFAEAYNQRAIWFFKRGEFSRAVEDCEKTLQLNPYHFGAAAGMGQCLVKLGKSHSALRAYQMALAINPALDHLQEVIRGLEQTLERED
jgi:tetratricopeptide (TPR) repeat protein